MIKEYDKRDLLKFFEHSKLTVRPLRTTIEVGGETFFVPAREYYLTNERVTEYYNYALKAVESEKTFDNFFKIVAIQSWPVSYIPGRKNNEMYNFLRNYTLARMEEYNIIYLNLVKQKKIADGTITITRTHMVGRLATEKYFDYSTSPFYKFYIDGREYIVPSFNVSQILEKINERARKDEIIKLLTAEEPADLGKLQKKRTKRPPRRL